MASSNPEVDIIVLESQEDLNIIKQALDDIKLTAAYMLRDKSTRVHLFESALKHYGFTEPVELDCGVSY